MFKYYYNGDPSQLYRKYRTDIITIETPKISREPLSFREECSLAATRILEKDTNIWLGLTGGWLSKIILDSFLSIGFKPNVFIMEFPASEMDIDASWAKKICVENDIEPMIIEAFPSKTPGPAIIDFGTKVQIYSYHEQLLASKVRTIPGRAVISDGLEIRRDVDPRGNWSFIIDEDKTLWPQRYTAMFPQKRIISSFFTSSPEILLSFLETPFVQTITDGSVNGKISLNSSRNTIFNNAGFTKESPWPVTQGHLKMPDADDINTESTRTLLGFQDRKLYLNLEELKKSLRNQERTWEFI